MFNYSLQTLLCCPVTTRVLTISTCGCLLSFTDACLALISVLLLRSSSASAPRAPSLLLHCHLCIWLCEVMLVQSQLPADLLPLLVSPSATPTCPPHYLPVLAVMVVINHLISSRTFLGYHTRKCSIPLRSIRPIKAKMESDNRYNRNKEQTLDNIPQKDTDSRRTTGFILLDLFGIEGDFPLDLYASWDHLSYFTNVPDFLICVKLPYSLGELLGSIGGLQHFFLLSILIHVVSNLHTDNIALWSAKTKISLQYLTTNFLSWRKFIEF